VNEKILTENTMDEKILTEIRKINPNADVCEKMVCVGLIESDEAHYQRPPCDHQIKRIVDNFNPLGLLGIIISQRADGSFWVIDGRRRSLAGKRKYGYHYEVRAYVITGLTIPDEARLFDIFNAKRGPVSTGTRVRALYNANDPKWRGIIDGVLAGLKLDYEFKKSGHKSLSCGRLRCWGALEKIHDRQDMGIEHLRRTLAFCIAAWDRDPHSFSSDCVRGVAAFIARHENDLNPQYSDESVIKKLQTASFKVISRSASEFVVEGTAGDLAFMYALLRFYNSGKKKEELKTKTVDGYTVIRPER
jgi:hypothetical protein